MGPSHRTSLTLLLFLLVTCLNYGLCQGGNSNGGTPSPEPSNADEDEEEVPSTHVPTFLSEPQSSSVLQGDTVTFHCQVDDLGTFSTVWKKGESIVLFANSIRLLSDIHYHRLDNRSLQIRRVRISDAGDYHCIISSNPTVQIIHKLTVLVPPKITSKLKNHLTLKKGQPMTLTCEASGNPPPTITWKLLDGVFSDGKSVHEGPTLHTAESGRQQAGTYECMATNEVGSPATLTVRVHVNYAPEVESSKAWVHAGEETSAELNCGVRAHPPAIVVWRGPTGTPISDSDHFRLRWGGGDHALQIRKMRKEDFGDYVCEATNKEGTASAAITVSGYGFAHSPELGLASPAEFKSSPNGDRPTSYELKWMTHSHSTVIDYLLRIKPQESTEDWTEVRVPSDGQQGLLKSQNYEVTGLEPATGYKAVVQVHNKFGTNEPSREFLFYTQGASVTLLQGEELITQQQFEQDQSSPSQSPAQPHQQDPSEEDNKGGSNGSSTSSNSKKLLSLLTVIILSVFFWF